MDKKTIETILLFMERVQLTGKETVAFNACVAALVESLREVELAQEVVKEALENPEEE